MQNPTTYIKDLIGIAQTVKFPPIKSLLDLYKVGFTFHFEVQPVEQEVIGTLQNAFLVIISDEAGNIKYLGKYYELCTNFMKEGYTRDQINGGFIKAAIDKRLRVVKTVQCESYFRTTQCWIMPTDDRKGVKLTIKKAEFSGQQFTEESLHGAKYLFSAHRVALFNSKSQLIYQLTNLHKTEVVDCLKNERFRLTEEDLIIYSKA